MTCRTDAIKLTVPVLLVACWASAALAEQAGPKMLVHGNYCGFGNNAPLAPIDALDAACSRHDACTPDNDLPLEMCNLQLEREAQAIALDMRQPHHVRTMAGFVAAYASTAPSRTAPDVVPVTVRAATPRRAHTSLR